MGSIEIRIDKTDLENFFQEKLSELPQKAQDLIIDISSIYQQIASVEAPYLTGGLRDSIQTYLGSLEAEITSTLNYFEYIILGTPEHSIGSPVWIPQAVGWRYIGLSPAGRGKPHPGTKANDFMQTAFDSASGEVDSRIDDLLSWLVDE